MKKFLDNLAATIFLSVIGGLLLGALYLIYQSGSFGVLVAICIVAVGWSCHRIENYEVKIETKDAK